MTKRTRTVRLKTPVGPVAFSVPHDEGDCLCGHPLHKERCQQPVRMEYPGTNKKPEYLGCGCFRVNGELPQEWKPYFGEARTN